VAQPGGLFFLALGVVVLGLFGKFADKRELEGAMARQAPYTVDGPSGRIDYIADVGDGWNATATMAWLLTQERLSIQPPHEDLRTERGSVLIMDEFSRMLGRLAATRRQGDGLAVRVMDDDTDEKLTGLASGELPGLREELRGIEDEMRRILEQSDPTFLVCWVSFWNTLGPPGEYFEPTHEGLKAKVEFVSGLAAGLPRRPDLPPDPAVAQAILGLVDEAFEMSKLVLTAEAEAYAQHDRDLAKALF
jgi:hypothetical protein